MNQQFRKGVHMHPNLFTKAYLTSDEILEVLDHALNSFNVTFDSDYSRDDILVGFFTFADFPSVYERFCKKNFPSWLKEDYTNPAFYEYTCASALYEGKYNGILINANVQCNYWRWYQILLHELSHLFASRNEYHGEKFYDKHCADQSISMQQDSTYLGYTIWKEFIADYMACLAMPFEPETSLARIKDNVNEDLDQIEDATKYSMLAMTRVLSDIFTTKEFFACESWECFNGKLMKLQPSIHPALVEMFSVVYNHLKRLDREAYKIHEDFIAVIGSTFQSFVFHNQSNLLRNRLFGDE